ncbi:hypothetical protein [Siminovitchia fortis]|nr:hypothetical protein [Siminovitchia fortis]
MLVAGRWSWTKKGFFEKNSYQGMLSLLLRKAAVSMNGSLFHSVK